MKIAVPSKNLFAKVNVVDDHFGHCQFYTIFSIENNKIVEESTLPSPQGCGCKSNIAYTLQEMGVTLMLAGNMGEGAKNVLANCNINVIRGCSGNVTDLVNDYLQGKISDSGETCNHHSCGNN